MVFLKIPQNLQENICARASFFIKMQASACNFIKEQTPAQVFSCEFGEIFKNTVLYRTTPMATSKHWTNSASAGSYSFPLKCNLWKVHLQKIQDPKSSASP